MQRSVGEVKPRHQIIRKRICPDNASIRFIAFYRFRLFFLKAFDDGGPLALTDDLCIRVCRIGAKLGIDQSEQRVDRLFLCIQLTQTERALLSCAVQHSVPDKRIQKVRLYRRIIRVYKRCCLPFLRCFITRCSVYGKVIDDHRTACFLI